VFKVQKRIVPVKPAEELPNLVGNHCPETPFQYPSDMTPADLASLPGTATVSPTIQEKCHAWGVIRNHCSFNELTIRVVRRNNRSALFVHQTSQRSDWIRCGAV
jgi:hypothetical protein